MEVFYPKYYETFSCIAAECPDSCCKEWSVDVDPQAAAFYRQLSGDLGDRLREVLQDTEDGTIMTIENGRCPMWRADGLCRIQAELGHDALCKVCREFPRLTHDYGDFIELGLELSCPEAARIILSGTGNTILSRFVPGGEEPEYDSSAMAILKRTRAEFFTFLETTLLPFPKILTTFLLYAHSVQEELDGGEKAVLLPEVSVSGVSAAKDLRPLQDFFLSLEILTPQWKTMLEAPTVTPYWKNGHKSLLHYFVLRYWLQAVSDYDIVCRAKFVVAACLLIGGLGGDLVETAQLFSKEIENDPDNVEAILDGAYSHPALTDIQLLQLLQN
ncbi:MAG: flagellin lysine-N-methylase [Oscillospiraceae bacterium]|nr:flagellin lysine-N-methylase [Oscillospiraceae bacterium]